MTINVRGAVKKLAQDFDAIIDTGFSGFLCMPLLKAFPLGLILHGTTDVVLADGNTHTKLTALGNITAGEKSEVGVIILEPSSSDLLLGMEFLSTFNLSLFVHDDMVSLIDSDTLPKREPKVQAKPEAVGEGEGEK